jgi:hypothetical protein
VYPLLHTIPSPMQGYCYSGGGGYGRVGGYGGGSLRVPRYGMVAAWAHLCSTTAMAPPRRRMSMAPSRDLTA